MRIPRIYTPGQLAPGTTVALDEQAANHVARVLRMQPGQALVLFNGDGLDYRARVAEAAKRQVTVAIEESGTAAPESPLRVTLGQVVSRGDRMDYAIQKSVELGANAIVPLVSERCEVKLQGEREDKRLRRWQQVAISAAEQSGRACITRIAPLQSLSAWLDSLGASGSYQTSGSNHQSPAGTHKLVLHHHSEQPLSTIERPDHLILLIGPEGGLTEAEVTEARAAGFLPTAFGGRVMRTETAPVAALAVCQWLWGDWQAP